MASTIKPPISVYFTLFKNVSTQVIYDTFVRENIGIVVNVFRKPHNVNKKCDEVFVHFCTEHRDIYVFVSSMIFFNSMHRGQPVKLCYNDKRYWVVFPNVSNKLQESTTIVPKLSNTLINKDKEYYEEQIMLKNMQMRDLSELLDKQFKQIKHKDKIIKDLNELLNALHPECLKIYELQEEQDNINW